jgi:rare lipoprotein A
MKKLFSASRWEQIAVSGPLFLLLCIVAVVNTAMRSSTPVQARPSQTSSTAPVATSVKGAGIVGVASYYGFKYQGRPTASGETFDMHQLTAAHPSYPFGTRVKVTSLANNRSVIVRVNDRGPFVKGRIIDLSEGAAQELDMIQSGLAEVKLEILD